MAKKKTKKNKSKKRRYSSYNRPNIFGMIQNVLIASMNRGQLLLSFIGLFFLIIVLRLPPKDLLQLLKSLLNIFKNYSLIGWALAFFITFVCFYLTKKIRQIHSREMDRISLEKTELQKKIDKGLKSSKKR